MTKIDEIYKFIDNIAPFNTAMSFDNVGLLVGDKNNFVNKVLLSLDITKDVVKEAEKLGANLIISHHPVIFNALKNISTSSVVYSLIKSDISAICAHTNLDMAKNGVNYCLANALKLNIKKHLKVYSSEDYNKIVVFCPKDYTEKVYKAMANLGAGTLGNYNGCAFISKGSGRFVPAIGSNPFIGNQGSIEIVDEEKIEVICKANATNKIIEAMKSVHPYEEPAFDIFKDSAIKDTIGLGLIGTLDEKMAPDVFAKYVKEKLNCNCVRYINGNKDIQKVAVCSGAGGDALFSAIENDVDAYVTGEVKHHESLIAYESKITVVDAGHFNTEDIVINPLIKMLFSKFKDVEFIKSETFKDVFKYI